MVTGFQNLEEKISVPKYGFKVAMDKQFPDKGKPAFLPKLNQVWTLIPLFLRYLVYYIKKWIKGKTVLMDYFDTQTSKKMYGVPLGGIGVGTIGRGFKGEFCRFQLIPGMYKYNTVFANQFIVTIKNENEEVIFHSLLSAYKNVDKNQSLNKKEPLNTWSSKLNPAKCLYTGLYPRSWTEYDLSEFGIKLICRQVSPVIPHNYKDSALPCSMFLWEMHNLSSQKRSVSIAFTFKNGIGEEFDKKATCNSKGFTYQNIEGVVLYNTIDGTPCKYVISSRKQDDKKISKCLHFDPNSDGKEVWEQTRNCEFTQKEGKIKNDNVYGEMGVGICNKTDLEPLENKTIEYSLVWDMPVVTFSDKKKKFKKFYTQLFPIELLKMVNYCFENYQNWENDIYKWQSPILNDSTLPDWYKSAIFNETYFVSDGGSFWFCLDDFEAKNLPPNDPRLTYGRFGYLEGHEYRMVNTYDVHFYASFALVMNFPNLQKVLQYDFKDSVFMEIPDKVTALFDGRISERKVKNSVPHDVGDPAEQPFTLVNAYPIHDVSEWRDLNSKFVLQVYRDFCLFSDDIPQKLQYLQDMIEACHVVMQKSMDFDIDGDGLIENSGTADQTFDTWVMKGSSAYCGSLWLAALFAMETMYKQLDDTLKSNYYKGILAQAKDAFNDKLWNGEYYNFDCSENARTIMADQLCGQWYLRCCGHQYEVFNKIKVAKSLKTVFDNNVMKFAQGNKGAVNGYTAKGIDEITVQSEEVWTGVTYGVASLFFFEGLEKEAWTTAGGMYKTISETMGMSYETPEAIYENYDYRSIGYMRPLSIWAIQLAVEKKNNAQHV